MRAQLLLCLALAATVSFTGCGDAKKLKTAEKKHTDATTVSAAERSLRPDKALADAARAERSPEPAGSSAFTTAAEPPAPAYFERFDSNKASGVESRRELNEEAPRQTMVRQSANPERYRAGILTAGSFDDHVRYHDYRKYLSAAIEHDANESLPRLALGERIIVRVINEKNEPVSDAAVQLHLADRQQPVGSTRRTDADGRVVFLSSLDQFATDGELVAEVVVPKPPAELPNGHKTPQPSEKVARTGGETTIHLYGVPRNLPQQLDLSLVIDTTGSMSDELEYLKAEIDSIAAAVHKRFPNVDQRYSLVVYRDEGDEYVARKFDFTSSLSEFQTLLSAQHASGGGDYPEAMHVALEQANSLAWRKDNTARVMFLVADAPPHRRFSGAALRAVQLLHAKGVTIFPVAASGVRDEAEFVLRGMAFLTRGRYLFLTDHSGVGNPHERPNVPDFQVERLDQLMIRMIAWKLSGDETGMREILATSQGEDAAAHAAGIPLEQNNVPQPTAANGPIAPSPRASRHSSSSLVIAIIGELWKSNSWFQPNRYWLFGLIVAAVIALDRREVRRRRTILQTTYSLGRADATTGLAPVER